MAELKRPLYSHGVRALSKVVYEANTTKTIDIPRDFNLKRIVLQLNADAVVVNAGGLGAVLENAALKLIENIEIVGNGVSQRVNLDGVGLYYMNAIEKGVVGAVLDPTAVASATYPVAAFIEIPFANKMGYRPIDSLLRSRDFQSLQLRIRWAAPTAMFDAAFGGTCTISTAYGIQPVMYETASVNPTMVRFLDYQEKVVTATGQIEFELPLQRMYQGVMIKTTDAGVRESDIVTGITVKTSENIRHWDSIPFVQLQNENQVRSGLATWPAGIAYMMLTEDGMISSGINAYNTTTCKLILNCTVGGGTTVVRVYTDSFVL